MMPKSLITLILILSLALLSACGDSQWNHPHKAKATESVYHASFTEQPKTLDPARAYSANENLFIAQIYEPPLQYHYLKRPFTLEPLTANGMPRVEYFSKNDEKLPDDANHNDIAYSLYTIKIKPGIFYHPHPAFVKDSNNNYKYHNLSAEQLQEIQNLRSFPEQASRELIAKDYVYQIKRLASPKVQSPIYGLMSQYIFGLQAFNNQLLQQKNVTASQMISHMRDTSLLGAKAIDRYTYQIKIKGKYQQFLYWLAMPFFAPVPWEADLFYSQPGLKKKNISLGWYPVGTGPYQLTDNNPNRQMVLEKNVNYRKEFFPETKEKIPYIDKYHFSLEKESIPRWGKFLQGYYDQSSIASDNFDQAIQLNQAGEPELTDALKSKDLKLNTNVSPAIFYFGFNMLDPVVGGNSERARKLRQAISIALNFEEYVNIFLNGRGMAAHSPIPKGIFGYESPAAQFNPIIYEQTTDGSIMRKNITEAKKLLAEAGYANGRDAKTGEPLVLYFDTVATGPESKSMLAWLSKQFRQLGIQLQIRSTQYNRFQQKMRTGNAQMYMWGWLADYPDPENFLFLLYGPNGKVKFGGENASNYQNKRFDKLYEQMQHLANGPEREAVINAMLQIVQNDAPWVWGYFPKDFQLSHSWLQNNYPNSIANNTLKYYKLDNEKRQKKQTEWNQPLLWPLLLLAILMVMAIIPVAINYWRKLNKNNQKAQ